MTQAVPEASTPTPTSERSQLSRKWTLKIGIIGLALFALGLWGVWDAAIKFPNAGAEAAEYLEFQYLKEVRSEHREFAASVPSSSDQRTPSQRLRDLSEKSDQGAALSAADRQLRGWLDQLKIIGRLEPASESTQIPRADFRKDEHGQPVQVKDYGQRLADLQTKWSTANTPTPQSTHDIHIQWLIAAGGLGVGGWMLALLLAARTKVYRWNAPEQRLTFPDGTSLVPSDIAEFDKRKWHKLFITLKVRPTHPQLGGKEVEIDLLRYEPVEDWVLTMERTAFPEDAPPASPPSEAPAPAAG
jgi:hypothetical protein